MANRDAIPTGLLPLDAVDAAVYFGRESEILIGVDNVRAMRDPARAQMLAILGASGAGKSSFLRAGLWPRLARDDRSFLAMPVIRARRSVLDDEEGLAAVLCRALQSRGLTLDLADARALCREPSKLQAKLDELYGAHTRQLLDEKVRPAWVISIDQAEELYRAESTDDSRLFLDWLTKWLGDRTTGIPKILILTIRTDFYSRVQDDYRFGPIGRETFDLPPIDRSRFQKIIEGPAERASSTQGAVEIDPRLIAELLRDSQGVGSLPMLAFALQRLPITPCFSQRSMDVSISPIWNFRNGLRQ
jgi:hypothetical protein